MSQPLWITVVAVGWITLGLKLVHLHRSRSSPAMTWMCASVAALAFSSTLQIGFVRDAVDGIATHNTAGTLSNCAALVAAVSAQCSFLHMVQEPGDARAAGRIRVRWTAGTIVLILVLFTTTPSNYAEMLANATKPVQVPVTSAAGYVFVVWIAVLAVGLMLTARSYFVATDRFSLSCGLVSLMAGALCVIGYAVARFAAMTTYLLDVEVRWLRGSLIGVLFALATVFVFAGIVLPPLGARIGLDHLARWWRIDRTYRALFPLWKALHDEFPQLVLDAPAGRHADFRAPERALYRRGIEIWDGRLQLRPHLDPDAAPGGSEAEAALITDALWRRRNGVAPAAGRAAPDNRPSDPDAEITWLVEVSRALTR